MKPLKGNSSWYASAALELDQFSEMVRARRANLKPEKPQEDKRPVLVRLFELLVNALLALLD